MPLCRELAAIGLSTLVCGTLVSAVFRLRVQVDLLILSSIPLGLETFVAMRSHLRFVPESAEEVGGVESARSGSSGRASAREEWR